MINEGGKWAHVVLRKCVFEPKAAGISSLMHQPSTGHLRSDVCCAVSFFPAERHIDSPKTLFRSLTFFLFLFFFPPLQSIFFPLCPPLSFLHLFQTFASFNYHFLTPVFSLVSLASVFLLSPCCLSPLHSQLHTLHNSISVFCVCFLPLK